MLCYKKLMMGERERDRERDQLFRRFERLCTIVVQQHNYEPRNHNRHNDVGQGDDDIASSDKR